jgi:hypothetical protein
VGSCCVRGVVLLHIVRQVEDDGHHVTSGQHVVCVERVDFALFGLTVWAGARNTAQHEETKVFGVNGSGTINHLTCLVVVVIYSHTYIQSHILPQGPLHGYTL